LNRHGAKLRGILSPLRLPNSATPAVLERRTILLEIQVKVQTQHVINGGTEIDLKMRQAEQACGSQR
jgi:hypothetical protein